MQHLGAPLWAVMLLHWWGLLRGTWRISLPLITAIHLMFMHYANTCHFEIKILLFQYLSCFIMWYNVCTWYSSRTQYHTKLWRILCYESLINNICGKAQPQKQRYYHEYEETQAEVRVEGTVNNRHKKSNFLYRKPPWKLNKKNLFYLKYVL